jgi:hypothetical protein
VRPILAIGVILCAAGGPAAIAPRQTRPDSLAFRSSRPGEIVVPVTVNGAGPFPFLLDTGASHTAISSSLARELGATAVAKTIVTSPVGEDLRPVVRLDHVDLGPVTARAVMASLVEDEALCRERRIRGLLGQDVLALNRYTIDFRDRLVIWNERPPRWDQIVTFRMMPSGGRYLDETGAALGAMFLSVPGDVDGDGVADVYASDFSNSAKGPSTGRTVVHSGKDGRRLLTLTGETAGEGFGTSPSVAGDVNGDGHADLIVGAWQYAGAAISGGRAYLYSGRDGTLLKTYTCKTPGDTFGFDAVTLGDIDADGMDDLLITSAWSGVRGFHSGRIFVVSSGLTKAARK